jgi:hypothetical protein
MTPVTDQRPGDTASRPTATPQPRRGGRGEAVTRVAIVLVLLGIAVGGLSGRRDLDWAAISDSPGSSWIGLMLITAATFVVVSSIRALARMVRVSPESDDDAVESIEGRRVPWYAHLAAVLIIAVVILLVYFLVKSAVDQPAAKFRDQGNVNTQQVQRSRPGDQTSTDTWLLLSAALVGAVLAVVGLRRRGGDEEQAGDGDEEPTEREVLAGAVAAAEVELDSHGDDTRAAIIAAYLAMERQLVAGGTARQASDTPTDFLLRATAASRVSRGAATRLTELFREARFSTHPMAVTARADAARALARVADDLARDPASSQDHPYQAGPRG